MVLLFADKEEESVVFLTTFLVVAFEFLPVLDKEKEEEESADFDDKENIFVFVVVETLFGGRSAGYPRRRRTMMMLASRGRVPCDAFEKCGCTTLSRPKIHQCSYRKKTKTKKQKMSKFTKTFEKKNHFRSDT